MNSPLPPLLFHPIYKPKPWGGRRLQELFGKPLPGDQPIGESWEIASLPGNESVVRGGPLDGCSLAAIVEQRAADLLGKPAASPSGTEPGRYPDSETSSGAEPGRCARSEPPRVAGRFPLLVKFLDARQHLSVQVHPNPDHPDVRSGMLPLKHEAWYVLDADPGAQLFIGFKPGVTERDVRERAGRPEFADLLRARPAEVGCCFHLPSGTPHALGAGTVVAEVQTPSDVTYRFFDWSRTGLDGQPRPLHIDQAIEHVRYDIGPADILIAPSRAANEPRTVSRVATCAQFTIDHCKLSRPAAFDLSDLEMSIWIWLCGAGTLRTGDDALALSAGDVALIPAVRRQSQLTTASAAEFLEIRVPTR